MREFCEQSIVKLREDNDESGSRRLNVLRFAAVGLYFDLLTNTAIVPSFDWDECFGEYGWKVVETYEVSTCPVLFLCVHTCVCVCWHQVASFFFRC